MNVQQLDAVARANAHLSNAGLPDYYDLLTELVDLTRRVEDIVLPDGSTPDTLSAQAVIATAMGRSLFSDDE